MSKQLERKVAQLDERIRRRQTELTTLREEKKQISDRLKIVRGGNPDPGLSSEQLQPHTTDLSVRAPAVSYEYCADGVQKNEEDDP